MGIITDTIINFVHTERSFTDLHIVAGLPILGSAPAGYTPLMDTAISEGDIDDFLSLPSIAGKEWKTRLTQGPIEVAQTLRTARVRCSVYETMGSDHKVKIAIRVLPLKIPDHDSLGLPKGLDVLALAGKGLFLITGPTGAGKTTTMASLLDRYNNTRSGHILTVEQPIEYIFEQKRSIVSQCEVDANVKSFAAGVHQAMRYNPDIIAIGEVLDGPTADAMLRAASSGHLVLATMHTRSCADTVESLLQMFEGHDATQKRGLLASVLRGVITQILVPSIDNKRLLLAYEILLNNGAVATAIRDGKIHQIKQAMSADRNMRLLNSTLSAMVQDKRITLDTARRASYDEDSLPKS